MFCPECHAWCIVPKDVTSLACPTCGTHLAEEIIAKGKRRVVKRQANNCDTVICLGVLLIIIGFIGFFVSAPRMEDLRSSLGQLVAGLNSDLASERQRWQNIYYGSLSLGGLGFIIFLGGMIKSLRR